MVENGLKLSRVGQENLTAEKLNERNAGVRWGVLEIYIGRAFVGFNNKRLKKSFSSFEFSSLFYFYNNILGNNFQF